MCYSWRKQTAFAVGLSSFSFLAFHFCYRFCIFILVLSTIEKYNGGKCCLHTFLQGKKLIKHNSGLFSCVCVWVGGRYLWMEFEAEIVICQHCSYKEKKATGLVQVVSSLNSFKGGLKFECHRMLKISVGRVTGQCQVRDSSEQPKNKIKKRSTQLMKSVLLAQLM